MSQKFYHYIIYNIITFLFMVFQVISDVIVVIRNRIEEYYYYKIIPRDWDYITENVKYANKIPAHFTILLNEQQPSFVDLVKLVTWCAAAGISFVSIYDRVGILRGKEDALEQTIEKGVPEKVHVIWQKDGGKIKNGFVGKKVCIKIITPRDGRASLIDVVKDVVDNKDEQIDQNIVAKYLQSHFTFPDPELGIYFDKFFCPYGFPPWQMVTTEFLRLDTQYNLNVQTFVGILYKYSRIEQRWGA